MQSRPVRFLITVFFLTSWTILQPAGESWGDVTPGTLDTSFGTNGYQTYDFFGRHDSIHSIVRQPDGKFVLFGETQNISVFSGERYFYAFLKRIDAAGIADTDTFNSPTGQVLYLMETEMNSGLAIDDDGDLVAVARKNITAFNDDMLVLRYLSSGDNDTSFGTDGAASFDRESSYDEAHAVAIDPSDNDIIVAGYATNASANKDAALWRITSSGQLDPSFNGGSAVYFDRGMSSDEEFLDVALQEDGKIIVAGHFDYSDEMYDALLMRYNPDGSMDSTFDGGGQVWYSGASFRALSIQEDGTILAAGQTNSDELIVVRYNSDGSIDTGFGVGGTATYSVGAINAAYDVVVQSDGKIVVAGETYSSGIDVLVLRFNQNGTLDTTFGPSGNGAFIKDIYSDSDRALAVTLDADENIYVAGEADASGFNDALVLKLHGDPPPPAVPFSGTKNIKTSFDQANALWPADIDGDGDLDVVSAGSGPLADRLKWSENTGTDENWITTVIDTGSSAYRSVKTADIDRDGDTDVVACIYGSPGWVLWWQNVDNGTFDFDPARNIIEDTLLFAFDVEIADIDGDGFPDVVASHNGSSRASWWKNNGDGSFWTEYQIGDTLNGIKGIHIADIDRDGDEDVLTANADNATWWENNGDGTGWIGHVIDNNFYNATAVIAADIDGDGDMDVVGGADTDIEGENKIAWWENRDGAGGSWGAHSVSTAFNNPENVYCSDIDSDGDVDILANSSANDLVTWWENDGSPRDDTGGDGNSWSMHDLCNTIDAPRAVCAADLDSDGDQDVLAAAHDGDTISWWKNETIHGSASFLEEAIVYTLAFHNPRSVYSADVNNDGEPDILSASTAFPDALLEWFPGNGDGTFGDPQLISDNASSNNNQLCVFASDIDGDGDMDALSASRSDNKIAWYENLGGGNFGSTATNQKIIDNNSIEAACVYAADMDGDGDMDVLSASTGANRIAWHENTAGDGSTWDTVIVSSTLQEPYAVSAADLDGDGDMDIVAAAGTSSEIVWYENDDGFTERTLSTSTSSWNVRSIVPVDLNSDGTIDIVAGSVSYGTAWYKNTGGGNFGIISNNDIVINGDVVQITSVHAADFDSDGDPDIGVTSYNSPNLTWFENGNAWDRKDLPANADYVYDITSADFDSDGDVDIVTGHYDGISYYQNRGGQFALTTDNASSPGTIEDGGTAALLKIIAYHRGAISDSPVELSTFELSFDNGTDRRPLSSAEANALIENLYIYYDDGDGSFDAQSDSLLLSVDTLALTGGVATIELPDVGDISIDPESAVSMAYFVAVEMTDDASSQDPGQFRITHITEASSTARDGSAGSPLTLEYAPNSSSGTTGVSAPTSSQPSSTTTTAGGGSPGGGGGGGGGGGATTTVLTTITTTVPSPPPGGGGGGDDPGTEPGTDPGGPGGGGSGLEPAFAALPLAGYAPLTVSFLNASEGDPASFLWDFGDGTTAAAENPVHIYETPGSYPVTLTIMSGDDSRSLTIEDFITVTQPPVNADFTASPAAGNAPHAVQFTDTSTGTITSWAWDFGDGATGTEQNPAHTYGAEGLYTVTLTVSGPDGSFTVIKHDLIDVKGTLPEADFTARPTEIEQGGTVVFLDRSTGQITEREWNFGDGQTGDGRMERHTYEQPGTYPVCLRVRGPLGSSTKLEEALITVTPAANTFEIGGEVSGDETAGVSVSLIGPVQAVAATGPDGRYGFAGLPLGEYTVRPFRQGLSFVPESALIRITDAGRDDVDFVSGYEGPRIERLAVDPTSFESGTAAAIACVAALNHPGGLDRIASVEIDLSAVEQGKTAVMVDDGSGGDETAGDGLYTYVGSIEPTAGPGSAMIVCTAVDTYGASYAASAEVKVVSVIDGQLGGGDTFEFSYQNGIPGQTLTIRAGLKGGGSTRVSALAEQNLLLQIFKPGGEPALLTPFPIPYPAGGRATDITIEDAEPGLWTYQIDNPSSSSQSFTMKTSGSGTGTVNGFVADAQTGEGVDDAAVNTSIGVVTVTTDGFYAMLHPAGMFTVQAVDLAYMTASCSVTLMAGSAAEVNLALPALGDPPPPANNCLLSNLLGGQDRRQLQLLRAFRNEVLSRTSAGTYLSGLYYRHSPEITALVHGNSSIRDALSGCTADLMPLVARALSGRTAELGVHDRSALVDCLELVKQHASPALARDIDDILLRVETARSIEEMIR